MSKKKSKVIPCPSCKKKFRKIGDLNHHIVKTGCNEGKKMTILDFLGIDNKKGAVKNLLDELFN